MDCSVGAIFEHPCFAVRDVLKIDQFGNKPWKRGSRGYQQRIEYPKLLMTSLFRSIAVPDVGQPFLFSERGYMSGFGLSVRFDQAKHRVVQGCKSGSRRRQRDGDRCRDIRRQRGGGKTAGTSDACGTELKEAAAAANKLLK
jgi:hypothetical protein